MQFQGKELKAIAVIADLSEQGSIITRDQCMTVEHFDYQCVRKRDNIGHTYGSSNPSVLNFSLRITDAEQAKPFYEQLIDKEYGTISFVFDASFSSTNKLTNYIEALVADGFIIDIQEIFQSAATLDGKDEQILLRARMQVCSLSYLGQDTNKILRFVH